jgi:MFS family permease
LPVKPDHPSRDVHGAGARQRHYTLRTPVPPPLPAAAPPFSVYGRGFVLLLAVELAFGFALSTFFLLPKIFATAMGAGPLAIGLVGAAFAIAGMAAIPLVGARVDRPGRAPLIATWTLVMAVTAIGFLFVERVGPLAVVLRALQGVAWTVVFNVGAALAAEMAPPDRLARTIGIYGSSNLATNALAPAIAEPMLDAFGRRSVFALAAAAALVSFFLARGPAEHDDGSAGARRAGIWPVARRPATLRLMLVVLLPGVALGAMFTFGPPMALGLGIPHVGSFFVAYTAGALTVRLALGGVVDRIGPERACLGALVCYAAVVLAMRWLGPGGLAAIGAAFGLAHGFFFPAFMALSVTGLPIAERGRVLALANGAFNAGTALVLPLGAVAARAGYPAVFTIVAAGALAAAGILARWPVTPPPSPTP